MTVIYTALFGDYQDKLLPIPPLGVEAIAFVDSHDKAADGWETVLMPFPDKEAPPRLQAKWFKLFPHELFPEADVSIWIDAGWSIAPATAREMPTYLGDKGLCFFPHRWRENLVDELAATMALPKYRGLDCKEQVHHYYASGYMDENGLLECTALLRKHNEPDVKRFNEAWWKECKDWSIADQLSCPYLLWRERVEFNRFPFTLADQPWFQVVKWRGDI